MMMRKMIQTTWYGCAAALLLAAGAGAQVPGMMSYQGRVTAGGTNVNGTGWFKFALVNAGGDITYWSNDGSSIDGGQPIDPIEVAVSGGLFTVMLGDTSIPNMVEELSPVVLASVQDVRLRIWFSEDGLHFERLAPDQPVGAAPYALVAGQVPVGAIGENQVANGAISANKIAMGAVSANQIADAAITSNKLDWSTMPAIPSLRGYAENGPFDTPPEAIGTNSIALGNQTIASATAATVSGGEDNIASGNFTTIAGGRENRAESVYAAVGGGSRNQALGVYSFIGGGIGNHATRNFAVVAGGDSNRATNDSSAIVGGIGNWARGHTSFVGGGRWNHAHAWLSAIAGGDGNRTHGDYSAVVGGRQNTAHAEGAFVGGGFTNDASGPFATVAGGQLNRAEGTHSFVGGGASNQAYGAYASIPGGSENQAGDYAFAAGRRAKALQPGSFVWADSTDANALAVASDSVTFRASGGYRLFSNGGMTQGAELPANATTWSGLSDRNAKENFEDVDKADILEKLGELPLTAWNYKADPEKRRYVGPVAQDFHAAFGLGNDTTINTLDADGVALAAIQALYRENRELKARIERLEALIGGSP